MSPCYNKNGESDNDSDAISETMFLAKDHSQGIFLLLEVLEQVKLPYCTFLVRLMTWISQLTHPYTSTELK